MCAPRLVRAASHRTDSCLLAQEAPLSQGEEARPVYGPPAKRSRYSESWTMPLTWYKAFALGLGPTNPCPTDVHMESFPASVIKGVSLDYLLLPPRSAPVAAPGRLTPKPFSAHHCDPPTHRGFETPKATRSPYCPGGRVSGECLSAIPF